MLERIIEKAYALNASDIHLVADQFPKVRIDGSLTNLEGESALTEKDCDNIAREICGYDFPACGEADLAFEKSGRRLRANIYRRSGSVSCALRILSDKIPALESLGLPPAVSDFPELRRGIVLVTGETGSGKSTTLASVLDRINETRRAHILTLEDPIEYIHKSKKCLVNQREIGRDTHSFADGLRAALREDPDVILIGEMRDPVTIETALTAAETGHLVFATLHTCSAADSVDRIVDVFPAERQKQIRMQLSMTLQAVLTQQLLPKTGGGRTAACELMVVTTAIRNLIREGKTPQIANAIATSAASGSITMDNSIIRLCKQGSVSLQTAQSFAMDADYVRRGTVG